MMAGLAVLAARHTAEVALRRVHQVEGHRRARAERANDRHMAVGGAEEEEERRIGLEGRRRAEKEEVADILHMEVAGEGDNGPEAADNLPVEDILLVAVDIRHRTVAEVGDIDRGEEGDIAGRSLAAAGHKVDRNPVLDKT